MKHQGSKNELYIFDFIWEKRIIYVVFNYSELLLRLSVIALPLAIVPKDVNPAVCQHVLTSGCGLYINEPLSKAGG